VKPKSKSKRPAVIVIQRILVPIDFSKNSRRALNHAIALAEKFGARITLLHATSPVVYPTEVGILVADQKSIMARLQKKLMRLGHSLLPEKLRDKVIVREGQAHDEITTLAKKLKTDLIVLTTHGHTGLARVLMGSTAERIVRHAPCPVLTVRAG
jgi:universal stress protein A